MNLFSIAILALASPAIPFSGHGFQSDTKPTATLKLESGFLPDRAYAGVVTVEFAPGLHGYQNPPAQDYQIPLTIKGGSGVSVLKAEYPKGKPMRLAGEAKDSMVYAGSIQIPVTLKVSSPTATQVDVVVNYQQCNETSCFPPSSVVASCALSGQIRRPVPKPAVPISSMAQIHRSPVPTPAVRTHGIVTHAKKLKHRRRKSHHQAKPAAKHAK